MNKKGVKTKGQKRNCSKSAKGNSQPVSYRLKCKKTANGLSHFVMYGDIKEQDTLL